MYKLSYLFIEITMTDKRMDAENLVERSRTDKKSSVTVPSFIFA
jgi:hypothetical protein